MTDSGWKVLVTRWGAAIALVAMVVGSIGVTVFIALGKTPSAPVAAQHAPPPPKPAPPTPREFSIGVVVTGQNCPSAGSCAYTYTIKPNYIGLHPLPEQPFTVQYQVRGGFQPQNGELTVHGTQARFTKDVTVEGPAGAQLSATATQVALLPVFGPPVAPATPTPPTE